MKQFFPLISGEGTSTILQRHRIKHPSLLRRLTVLVVIIIMMEVS